MTNDELAATVDILRAALEREREARKDLIASFVNSPTAHEKRVIEAYSNDERQALITRAERCHAEMDHYKERLVEAMAENARLREVVEAARGLGDLSHLYEYEGDEEKCEWRRLATAISRLDAHEKGGGE